MSIYLPCPYCDGEKVFEENRSDPMPGVPYEQQWARLKWSAQDDGFYMNKQESCSCPITAAEEEHLEHTALDRYLETCGENEPY